MQAGAAVQEAQQKLGDDAAAAAGAVPPGVDPVYYAIHLLRTRRTDASIAVAARHITRMPTNTPPNKPAVPVMDEQMWFIQTKAMILNSWYDDVELEGEGMGDDLDNDHAVTRSTTAHNGTAGIKPMTLLTAGGGPAPGGSRAGVPGGSRAGALSLAPGSGRPISSRYGFSRPGTVGQQRPGQEAPPGSAAASRMGSRAGGPGAGVPGSRRTGNSTAWRPITGRVMRLGTASLQSVPGGPHIHLERLSLEKYARERPMVAKLLCDYLLYVEHRPRMAVELCSAALQAEKEVTAAALRPGGSGGAADDSKADDGSADGKPKKNAPGRRSGGAALLNKKRGLGEDGEDEEDGSKVKTEDWGAGTGGTGGGTVPQTSPNNPGASPLGSSARPPEERRYQPQVGIPISQDWWWKARLGKANYQLGLYREAEKWFKASLFDEGSPMERNFQVAPGGKGYAMKRSFGKATATKKNGVAFTHYHPSTVMELCKVYLKLDQPLTAMDMYRKAIRENPTDPCVTLCMARLQDELHSPDEAFKTFGTVLQSDAANVEAIACVAAFYFYEKNQPELALRFYRRLLQMGVHRAEVWNNIALSAYLTSQFDFALSCFERSLQLCEDDTTRADVWYNVGHVGIALGDFTFAERALKIAVALDPTHGEALNNLAVLALQKRQRYVEQHGGKAYLSDEEKKHPVFSEAQVAMKAVLPVAPFLEEGLYNAALVAFEDGELEEAHQYLIKLLEAHPEHPEALELVQALRELINFQ